MTAATHTGVVASGTGGVWNVIADDGATYQAVLRGKLKIDGLGIVLIALGFACLEVVLDRGQTEDWFESNFILIFCDQIP